MFRNYLASTNSAIVSLILLMFFALGCSLFLVDPPTDDSNRQKPVPPSNSRTTTVILVRHAEKESEPANDPKLNVTGQVRAVLLAQTLAQRNIAAIYVTNYRRTQETAEPLATELELTPVALDDPRATAQSILANHAGRTVLVVGHTNTIPEIIRQLGGGAIEPITENDFERMFVVTVPADNSPTTIVESRY